MIEIKSLSFSYGKHQTLKDIDISFQKGKFYAIIGSNGSGKTTLINNIAGLIKPASGAVFLDGKNCKDIPRKELAKTVSLLPQGRNVPNMSVFDLVCAGRYPYLDFSRRLSREDFKIAEDAMKKTDIIRFAEHNIKKLSGGERQRVYLAMTLSQNTPYILLDEPIIHLDMYSEYRMLNLISDIKKQGRCVIAVLHNLELALRYADLICVMHKGSIVQQGTPHEIANSGVFEKYFGVRCRNIVYDSRHVYLFEEILS